MGGAPAGPARSNGAPARSATALRAGARADANVMELAEADDRPPHGTRDDSAYPNLLQKRSTAGSVAAGAPTTAVTTSTTVVAPRERRLDRSRGSRPSPGPAGSSPILRERVGF